jgi:hypothetical protein
MRLPRIRTFGGFQTPPNVVAKVLILYARWFGDTMDVRIQRIFTDWYGFFQKNPYQFVKIR